MRLSSLGLLPLRRGLPGLWAMLCLALAFAAQAQPAQGEQEADRWLRQGGVAVLFRHALAPGVGDPADFQLGRCETQRNLNDEGRAQSLRIGQWFQARGLAPHAVRSSAWCRSHETARLAFGATQDWAPLNSFFRDRGDGPQQVAAMREALAQIPAGRFEVWVTHQVNISGLTGGFPASGEGFVVRVAADGTVQTLARIRP